ncbi:MAG: conjugal transfer protein TraB [Spirochaetota bacterium]
MAFPISNDSPLTFGGILAIPSIHSRAYFAKAVREAFIVFSPDIIAVEQPSVFIHTLREAVSRLPNLSIILREADGEAIYIPVDPADSIIEAIRLAIEHEIPFACIDKDIDAFPENSRYLMPDDYLLETIGLERYYTEVLARHSFHAADAESEKRERFIAGNIFSLAAKHKRVLYVGGLSHWENIKRHLAENIPPQAEHEREGPISIHHLSRDSRLTVLGEMPFITHAYELYRSGKEASFDKRALIERIFFEAKRAYTLPLPSNQLSGMMKYLRNLALIDRHVLPDHIDVLTAAKCFVNNEFALNVLETLSYYPHDDEDEAYPTMRIVKDPLTDSLEGHLREKKIKLNRRDTLWRTVRKTISVTERPAEQYEGEWEDVWRSSTNHMSHVPEDIRMERYMDYLRTRIMDKLNESRTRVHPFTASIEDGIDMRETIRNYHNGIVYVREVPRIRGRVGPITVIFDDTNADDYPWRIAWLSEAHDDSDLILYATEPGDELIGPGMSRCYFGGYASIMPPQNVKNVWRIYPLLKAQNIIANEAELLLYASIVYAKERYVGYLSPTPPSENIKTFANGLNIEIVHLPLASFSSETIRKLRSFHVLGDKRLRKIAHRYIF